jgi:DNA-directed RNA polymerase specialized sigma subunit
MRLHSLVDRTKSGAHGEQNLGMDAINYYVGESIKRLFDPNGWDWKFEKYSLVEQLMRIANKLISDKVSIYRKKKPLMPDLDTRDVSEIYDLRQIAEHDLSENEEIYSKLIDIAHKISQDDDNLCFFTCRYFEGADYETIANEMGISIHQVYVLRKNLVRKLSKYRSDLTFE